MLETTVDGKRGRAFRKSNALFRCLITALLVLASHTTLQAQEDGRIPGWLAGLTARDWRERRDAGDALGELAPDSKAVVEALARALGDDDARVRRSAARALGRFGQDASLAVPHLIGTLEDVDPVVIEWSAHALGRIGPRASRAAPQLLALLSDGEPGVRHAAAEALGLIGRRARPAIGELTTRLGDSDPDVRVAAAQALGRLGRRASSSTPALIRLLHDEHAEVRASASEALSQLGKSTVPYLVHALKDGNPIFLQSVVDTLGLVGAPAVSSLIDTVNDTRQPLIARRYAVLALARIGSVDEDVVPTLVDRLDDESAEIRMSAAEALGKIGPAAGAATPKLIETSRDRHEDVLVREYAIVALSRVAPQDEEAVAALTDAVADGTPRIYEAGVAALMRASGSENARAEAEQLVLRLERQLEEPDPKRRESAATQLGALGPDAVGSVDALTQVLSDETNEPPVRTAAASALGLIGPDAEAAVPVLTATLMESNQALRRTALVALQRIGPQTRTLPALLEAMRAGELAVRGPAAASVQNFAKARLDSWRPALHQSDAPVLRHWLARYDALYGVDASALERESRRTTVERADFFDVLGGTAAIRESVQLDLIDDPLQPDEGRREYSLEDVDAITVASHPFDEMLQESRLPPRELALARLAPPDHFFAYFRSLEAFRATFDGGADLFARLESAFALKSIAYDLRSAYLSRLGLSAPLVEKLEATGAIGSFALIAPDLFFVDGTDITVVAEVIPGEQASAYAELVGMNADSEDVSVVELQPGKNAFWARRAGYLLMSTSEQELKRIATLADDEKKRGLGSSDEFRYMLQRLPLEDETQAYFYFSDAFIRHLVGPGTKIAQLRRMQARAEMEMLIAGALLYKLDGHHSLPSKERLIELGYAPDHLSSRDYTLRDDMSVHSEHFGTVAELVPLGREPVERVSEREREAYLEFADHYTQFWKQFFDPIAMRVNESGALEFELTTFILPLSESRLYDTVRKTLATHESGSLLEVPVLDPKPAMTFSVNLNDRRRVELSKELAGMLVEYASVDPEIFDSIGSAIHLAIQDSTPIVALGAGDVWGALSENMLRMQGFDALLPILLSLATQPATVLVELEEPGAVVGFLKDAVVRRAGGGGAGAFHQLEDQEAWIYTLSLDPIAQIHLRVEVNGRYLMISNLPWSERAVVTSVSAVPLNGARLQLNLDAIEAQLPALHTKALTDYRQATVDAAGYLYPLLASGAAATVEEASELHLRLFGYRPVHPLSGHWTWRDGELVSSIFGTPARPVQPEYVPGDRSFGLFPRVDSLSTSMELEESGLRARIRWRLARE